MKIFGGGREREQGDEQDSLEVLRSQHRVLHGQVDNYDRQLTEAWEQGDRATVQAIEKLIRPLRQQLAEYQEELDRRTASAIPSPASSELAADGTVAELERQVDELKQQVASLMDQVNDLARRLVEQDRTLVEQDRTLDEQGRALEGVKRVSGRQEVATLRRELASLRTLTEERIAVYNAHLAYAAGIASDGGVYATLARETDKLHRRVSKLETGRDELVAHIVDVARREAEQLVKDEVALVRTGLAELDASWANLRAERVRADSSQVRATDAVHTALATELASLARQRAMNLALGVNPAGAGEDPARFRAWVVREMLIACFAGPVVNDDAVRVALYGAHGRGPVDPERAAGLRRFVDAARRLRAKIAAAERQAEYDFDLPTEGALVSQYDVWPPSLDDATPEFVVVPAYRVAGHTFGLPIVFTRSPVTGPAPTSTGYDGQAG